MTKCNHVYVDGFGINSDTVVCMHCGKTLRPNWHSLSVILADIKGNMIYKNHPNYKEYYERAKEKLWN